MRTFEWKMFHLNCLCDCKKFKRIEKTTVKLEKRAHSKGSLV